MELKGFGKLVEINFTGIDTTSNKLLAKIEIREDAIKFLNGICKLFNNNRKYLKKIIKYHGSKPIIDFIRLALKQGFEDK